MTRINLGPAGNCASNTFKSLEKLKQLGLQSQEVEFTFGVQMKNDTAKKVGELRKKLGIELSIHAPYYINLGTEDKSKLKKSFKWVFLSCEKGHYLGAKNIVFHPGFYGKNDPSTTFSIIAKNIKLLQKEIKKKKWNVVLAPETTGKLSAFGDLNEILRLSKDTGCSYCIDFAHIFARNLGRIDYKEVLDKIKVKKFHSHFSCIAFTAKGEKNHLNISANKPSFKELAQELLKRKRIDITIIAESPRTWKDSLDMKNILGRMGHKF